MVGWRPFSALFTTDIISLSTIEFAFRPCQFCLTYSHTLDLSHFAPFILLWSINWPNFIILCEFSWFYNFIPGQLLITTYLIPTLLANTQTLYFDSNPIPPPPLLFPPPTTIYISVYYAYIYYICMRIYMCTFICEYVVHVCIRTYVCIKYIYSLQNSSLTPSFSSMTPISFSCSFLLCSSLIHPSIAFLVRCVIQDVF